jgi:hypothetical protein
MKAHREQGLDVLRVKELPGPAPKLTERPEAQLWG